MSEFQFIEGDIELINYVKPLWEKLNEYHKINSTYFESRFINLKFEDRTSKFINDDKMGVKVDLIKDLDKDLYIGYCISTINKELAGEIDSLFIEAEYRKYGLGDQLMNRALEWLNNKEAKTKKIVVAEGNENALEFYKKYNFYTKSIILEHKS
ncbi:GNAT family N-acetyltransferase [Romboutsia sp.]|uniref:GNAT family N-acetyltransferase n=1 Tax=Romboutsia sp. TaxID=1965302 RepID=UPI003F3EFD92